MLCALEGSETIWNLGVGNAGPLSFHGVHKTLTGTKNKVESSKRIQGPKCLAESWQNPQGSKRIKGP